MDIEKLDERIKKNENEKLENLFDVYKRKIDDYEIMPLTYTVTHYCRVTLLLCCHGDK